MANNIKINSPLGSQPQQKKGSGFVNLNKILQANVGNRLGETVAQGVGQGAQQVQAGLGQVRTDFAAEAEKQNLGSSQNRLAASEALKRVSEGQTDVSDEQARTFGTFLAGKYAGPKELDQNKTVQLGAKAAEVEGLGRSLAGGGDKTRLLQAFASKGGYTPYTAGQSRLDSLLLGQGPQAAQQLAEARQQTRGLTQQIGNEQEVARQIAQLRTGQAQDFAKDVRGQVGLGEAGGFADKGYIPDLLKAVDLQAEQARSKQGTDIQRQKELLTKLQNTRRGTADTTTFRNEFSALGLSPADAAYLTSLRNQELYGANLNDPRFLAAAGEANRSNIASAGDIAKAEALSKLSGVGFENFGIDKALPRYDINKPFEFDINNIKNLINQRKGSYETDIGGLEDQRKRLTDEYNAPRRGSLTGHKTAADVEREQKYYDALYGIDQQKRKIQDAYGMKYRSTPVKKEVPKNTGAPGRGKL